jgi:hypothetical protein
LQRKRERQRERERERERRGERDTEKERGVGRCRDMKEAWARRAWTLQYIQYRQLSLTVDIETVLVQGVVAQLGDTMGELTQLPVQLLYVQPRAHKVMEIGTGSIHSCGCSILLRPGERGMWRF